MSQTIDLLPLLPGRRRVRPNLADGVLAAGLSLLITAAMLGIEWTQLSNQQAHVATLQQALARKQLRTEEARIRYAVGMEAEEKRLLLEELRADRFHQRELLARVEALLGDRRGGFSASLAGLAAAHQNGTQITRVEILEAGDRLRVGGVTRSPELVTAYADRLGLTPVFEGIEFAALDIDGGDGDDEALGAGGALAFTLEGHRVAGAVGLPNAGAAVASERGRR